MKNIYLLLFLMFSAVVCAQDKLYVYQKDGVFDFFPCEKIDSITFSCIDTSGGLQSDFVTQRIHFSDTTYSIPLSSIDSVSYRAPETVFKTNVVHIENKLLPYVIRVESSYLLLRENIPKNLLPQTNEILLFGKQTTLFPNGFAGKVIEVHKEGDGWRIAYLIPELDEIYERFFYADYISLDDENVELQDMNGNSIQKKIHTRRGDPNLTYSIETKYLTVAVGLGMAIKVKYDINGEYSYVDVRLVHAYTFDIEAKLEGKVFEKREDKPFFQLSKPIEMSGCLLRNKLLVGGFIEGSGAVILNTSVHYEEKCITGFALTKTKGYTPYNKVIGKSKFDMPVTKLSMKGSLFAGISISYGLGLIIDRFNKPFGTQVDLGLKLDADLTFGELKKNPFNFYSNNKSSSLTFSLGGKMTEAIPDWAKKKFSLENKDIPAYDLSHEIYKWDLLPDFTVPKVTINEKNGTAVVQTTVSGNLLVPTPVGLALYKNEDIKNGVVENGGVYKKDYQNPMVLAFHNLEKGTIYKVRPILRLFDYTILGNQVTDFKIEGEEPDPDPASSDLVGTWEHRSWSGGFEHLVYQFNADGTFIWKDMKEDGTVDDSTQGTYVYNKDTNILTLSADGETLSKEVRLTKDALFIRMNYGEEDVWDEYKKKK